MDFNKIYVWEWDFPPFPFLNGYITTQIMIDAQLIQEPALNQANNDINKKRLSDLFPDTVQFNSHLRWINVVFINKNLIKERAYGWNMT